MTKHRNYSTQSSQPLHIENTALELGREDLRQGKAFQTYRDMKLDGIISGGMSFLKGIISKKTPKIGYTEGMSASERRLVDALNKSLYDNEDYTAQQYLSNWLTSLDYGVSLNEVVLKRVQGNMVFDVISPIHVTTVDKFIFTKGRLKELKLLPADNDGILVMEDSGKPVSVSGEKVMMVRNEPSADFPLGKSLLYGAYTSWKVKKILQEYEAIGVAKNLSGVMKLKIPSEYINKYLTDPGSEEALYVQNMIETAEVLHAGKGSYALLASDVNSNGVSLFEMDTIGGTGGNAQNFNVGAVIERYNREIMLAMQTSVLAMGQEGGGGSFALSDNQTNFLTLFIEYIRSEIDSGFKKALRLAYRANGLPTENLPSLVWPEIQTLDWDEFTKGWNRLLQAGGVTATEDLETFFRDFGGAPNADYSKKLDNGKTADPVERADDAKEL